MGMVLTSENRDSPLLLHNGFYPKKGTNTACNWELGNLLCSEDQCPWIQHIYTILRALEAIKLVSCYLTAQQYNELRLSKKSSAYS